MQILLSAYPALYIEVVFQKYCRTHVPPALTKLRRRYGFQQDGLAGNYIWYQGVHLPLSMRNRMLPVTRYTVPVRYGDPAMHIVMPPHQTIAMLCKYRRIACCVST